MPKILSFHEHHSKLVLVLLAQMGIIAVFTALLYAFGPQYIPLWYSLVESTEQLASREFVAVIPALALAIVVVTLWYGRRTKLEHEEYLAAISLWSGNLLLGFLIIALLRIMKVVI
ncbi:hypothetical protein LRY65_04115 [Candidatus Woesebacteria bacterium]|nr:hypothetical protein [Candidatus Woesebacteria bacterium]MCD8507526.1 hypothetical protein [Candidatus Woesebacteria bacterium]MCD8527365.1 hypothetical protein [Candidatus Woesebacteria bacterium]MCD8546112.1 hypothetical protein [Candidatus Woesebacteria bacterium]